MKTKTFTILIFLIIILSGIFYFFNDKKTFDFKESEVAEQKTTEVKSNNLSYSDKEYLFSIDYPESWGDLMEKGINNSECPEEDTYRTQDYLPIYDKELIWKEELLPGSESFISRGIILKYLDEEDGKICDNDLLKKLSTKEIIGEILSSVQLNSIEVGKFYGVYNRESSRLNTEHREQYTLFGLDKDYRPFVLQAYISFAPYSESLELKELDGIYQSNMGEYIMSGTTAKVLREKLENFRSVIMGIK